MPKTVSAPITLLNAANVAAASAGTKGAPGAVGAGGGWVDISQYDGGSVGLAIQNGGAVGVAGSILIQHSPDNGGTVFDYWSFGGDLVAYNAATLAGLVTATIKIEPGVKFIRVIGYGHTTSPVSYTAAFTGVTRS